MNLNISSTKLKRLLEILISFSIILCLLSGCNNISNPLNRVSDYSISLQAFDTLIKITIYDSSHEHADDLLKNCKEMCSYYEDLFSSSNPSSDIYKINHSKANPVAVSTDTIYILERAIYYSHLSDGLFDPTIYSVSQLWDFHDINNPVPSAASIKAALEHVDYKNINIDATNCTITLNDPKASIDVGGIAKGFIADKLCESLRSTNITGAIVNIGGDISTIGTKANSAPFTIGVYNPCEEITNLGVRINNESIATSGTYERMLEANGTIYHHILNPHTGYSADTDLVSATIITKKAIDADSLCTIAILLGSDDTLSLINSIDDAECILIQTDGTVLYSDNAKHLLSS